MFRVSHPKMSRVNQLLVLVIRPLCLAFNSHGLQDTEHILAYFAFPAVDPQSKRFQALTRTQIRP